MIGLAYLGAYHKGPLLFSLFINELFVFAERTDIRNFADDNIKYRCDSDLEILLEDLQHDVNILLNWFKINSINLILKNFNS